MAEYGYGQNYDTPAGIAFKAGINEEVTMTGFEVVEINTPKYQGKALDISFTKDGDTISTRKFPVNPANISPREITEKGGNRRMQTQDEAVREAFGKFNSWIEHIVTNYDHLLPEDKRGKFKDEFGKATGFESAVSIARNFLPAGFEKVKGSLIVGYDKKGYLQVPQEMWITGHFWSVEGSEKELAVNTKYISLTRPVQVQAAPADAPTDDTNW